MIFYTVQLVHQSNVTVPALGDKLDACGTPHVLESATAKRHSRETVKSQRMCVVFTYGK